MKVSRRSFLKGTSLGLGGIALAPLSVNATSNVLLAQTKRIPHANHYGPFFAYVKDNKIFDIVPRSDLDKKPLVMLQGLTDRVETRSRIKYPYVRKSYLEGKDAKSLRGREEFVRVSWKEALDLIHKKIDTIRKEDGNKALYNASYGGWAHPGKLGKVNTLAGRFFNTIGGAVKTSGDYSTGSSTPVLPSIMGNIEVYSKQTTHEQIVANTKVMILWGSDLYKTNRIGYMVPNHKNEEWYEKYKKAGIKFISIDPINTQSAQKFGAQWIKIRPGSDLAFMLGIMNYLYKNKLYSSDFIEKYTVGFDKFLPYLLGETDGIDKTPEWAEKKTDVPASVMKELAKVMVENRTLISGNWAIQRADNGDQMHWMMIVLASMVGQIGLSGGGFGFAMHWAGAGQANSMQRSVGGLSMGGGDKVRISIPASRMSDLILKPGQSITFKGNKLTYPKVKLMYVAGCSPIGHQPNTNEILKAFRTLETLVVQEPWWTPTAKMADIVLPVTTTLERDDITAGQFYSQDKIFAMQKVVDNAYEAKDDFWIFEQLAERFGKKSKFTGKKTQMQWIKSLYAKTDAAKKMKISFEDFWSKGVVEYKIPEASKKYVRHQAFRNDPVKNKLKTPSGKIEIFSKKFKDLGYVGYPTWMEPKEWLGSKEVNKYPFHMVSPHPAYRLHTQMDNTWVANAFKVNGREPVSINTMDAKKLGISDGDVVEVYNARGKLLAGAVVTDEIRSGVLAICEGAWYCPQNANEENSICVSGHVNVLSPSRASSSYAHAAATNSMLVGIKKAEGIIPPNRAYESPLVINKV